jgi:DNA-binding NtrC family response regulator
MIRNRLHPNGTAKQQLSRSVLIAGDDSAILSLMSDALEDSTYHAHTVMGVAETLQFVDADLPDVLICDFARSEVEGKASLEAAKTRMGKSAMRSTLALGNSPEGAQHANTIGINNLILKPFDCGTLVEHLDQLVAEQCGA